MGAWMWNPQVDALSARYRVLAPELRGFGPARLPKPTCNIEDYAEDMAKVLAERGIATATGIRRHQPVAPHSARQAPALRLQRMVERAQVLQVVQHARFDEMAENNHQRTLALRAPRGIVFDRNGQLLVENRHSYSISIVRDRSLSSCRI